MAGRSGGGGVLIAVKSDFMCERFILPNDYKLTYPTKELLAYKFNLTYLLPKQNLQKFQYMG